MCSRCEYLEEKLEHYRQLLEALSPVDYVPIRGMSPQPALMTLYLLKHGSARFTALECIMRPYGNQDYASPACVKVRMATHVRPFMTAHGIDVITHYRWGYELRQKDIARGIFTRLVADFSSPALPAPALTS